MVSLRVGSISTEWIPYTGRLGKLYISCLASLSFPYSVWCDCYLLLVTFLTAATKNLVESTCMKRGLFWFIVSQDCCTSWWGKHGHTVGYVW